MVKRYSNSYRHSNYQQLRDIGFNSREANRFKDFRPEIVEKLVTFRARFNLEVKLLTGIRLDDGIYELQADKLVKIGENMENKL